MPALVLMKLLGVCSLAAIMTILLSARADTGYQFTLEKIVVLRQYFYNPSDDVNFLVYKDSIILLANKTTGEVSTHHLANGKLIESNIIEYDYDSLYCRFMDCDSQQLAYTNWGKDHLLKLVDLQELTINGLNTYGDYFYASGVFRLCRLDSIESNGDTNVSALGFGALFKYDLINNELEIIQEVSNRQISANYSTKYLLFPFDSSFIYLMHPMPRFAYYYPDSIQFLASYKLTGDSIQIEEILGSRIPEPLRISGILNDYLLADYFLYKGEAYVYFILVPRITRLRDLTHMYLNEKSFNESSFPSDFGTKGEEQIRFKIYSIHETSKGHVALFLYRKGKLVLTIINSLESMELIYSKEMPFTEKLKYKLDITQNYVYLFDQKEGIVSRFRYTVP